MSLAHIGILLVIARWFYTNGQKGLMATTIIITIGMLVLSSWTNVTADWEQAVINFMPMWASVALGYFYTAFILEKLRMGLTVVPNTP